MYKGINQSKSIKNLKPILWKRPFITAEGDKNKEKNYKLVKLLYKIKTLKDALSTSNKEYANRFLSKRIRQLRIEIELIQDRKKVNPITRSKAIL